MGKANSPLIQTPANSAAASLPADTAHTKCNGMPNDSENRITDAGAHSRMAHPLTHREAQYRSLFENTGAGTIIIEKDTTISMANSGFAKMLHCRKEDIEGKIKWPTIIAEKGDLDKMLRFHHLRRTQPAEAPREYEFKLLDMKGQKKDIWLRIDMINGTDRSVASLFDITRLKQTERSLRASESKLSGILEAFGGFTYTRTRDYRITYMNKTLQQQVGRSGIGEQCYRVIYRLERPCHWCNGGKACNGDTAKQEFLNPVDGRWYHAVFSPVYGDHDTITETQTVMIDINERKQEELQLKQKEAHLEKENTILRAAIKERYRFGDIVGKSAAMQKVYGLILRAAATDANVMIYGESGTGKELVARAIHKMSERSDQRFVPVNCGAIPANLLESEFFGFKRGAFTGAAQTKRGLFEHAAGGTLFLDELGEIKEEMQVKLLRVLEGSGFTPIGDLEVKKPDVRIISATNKNLVHLLDKGTIREDFFYRVHIFPIILPPLRERKDDIPLLIEHFLAKHGRTDTRTALRGHEMEALLRHDWPGNVRELENTLQRYINLNTLDFMGFPGRAADTAAGIPLQLYPMEQPLRSATLAFEKAYLLSLLNKHQWNRTKVAAILGIERKTLYLKMKASGLQGQ